MKFFKTIPKNQEFFDVYARFAAGIGIGVWVAQIISGLTESGIIYQAVYGATIIFGHSPAFVAAVIGSILGVAMIEIVGLRFFLPMTVDSFLFNRWKGLHLIISVFCLIMTSFLILGSFFLSIEGKNDVLEDLLSKAEKKELEQAQNTYENNLNEETQKFYADSLVLANKLTGLIGGIKEKYLAEKSLKQKDLDFWKNKQQRTGRNYETRVNNAAIALQTVEAERTSQLNELKHSFYKEIDQLKADKRSGKQLLAQTLQEQKVNSATLIQKKKNRYSGGGGWIVILAISFSIIGIILQRVFQRGSGIKEKPLPNDYYFRESIWREFWHALSERFQQVSRSYIAKFNNKTKAPPLPIIPDPLYDLSEIDQVPTKIQLEQDEAGKGKIVRLNHKNRENRKQGNLRNCEYCNKEYVYRHHKQKYCSDACRMNAWEKRTGRKRTKKG